MSRGNAVSTLENLPSEDSTTPSSSGIQSPVNENDNTSTAARMSITSSLQDLQTEEQRRVLDTVSQIRKCGLESVLSLPQIVVCGDQSSGKSSVLEALTEIPFPRSDNLCTRFATELSLRREPVNSLTIRVIPDSSRPQNEQTEIKAYSETITNFSELPRVMEDAKKVMGISEPGSAFSKDILSIEICGPERPQLTLVDIPGLIQASTKGVSEDDLKMVSEITDHYIKQPRTICLAVIAATNDAANQPILDRVRKFDPQGDRTLGVITKLDKLDEGSGTEEKFLELARNEDVFFKLGWHAIRNRKFEERSHSFEDRNRAEEEFFRTSTFRCLAKENVGIDALRLRLSQLLFDHVKKELPRLYKDLESALSTNRKMLHNIGYSRSSFIECRAFLARLNTECYAISKAALGGNYEHKYFKHSTDPGVDWKSKVGSARLRAAVQFCNEMFAKKAGMAAHKYHIQTSGSSQLEPIPRSGTMVIKVMGSEVIVLIDAPQVLAKTNALRWVRNKFVRSRGTELLGNFNPSLVAELFWEQSEGWETLAKGHIREIYGLIETFLSGLLDSQAPEDVRERIQRTTVAKELERRKQAALNELQNLVEDLRQPPINYNHYYTDNIQKKRQERLLAQLHEHAPKDLKGTGPTMNTKELLERTVSKWGESVNADMEEFACEEALDCMLAIYKVQQKVFIANVTTQIIERRLIRGLEDIFSPMVAITMSDEKVEALVSEPAATMRERNFRADRVKKLEEGQEIFQGVMGGWN